MEWNKSGSVRIFLHFFQFFHQSSLFDYSFQQTIQDFRFLHSDDFKKMKEVFDFQEDQDENDTSNSSVCRQKNKGSYRKEMRGEDEKKKRKEEKRKEKKRD